MMKRVSTIALSVALSMAAFSSCSNDPTLGGASTTGSNLTFIQMDRVGRPGVNEVFATFAEHDANNRNNPTNDQSVLAPQINTFVTGFAGRSAATSTYLQALFTPDALIADLSQSGQASYLGWETGAQIKDYCTGVSPTNGLFGGRSLLDDVVDTTFGLTFGSTASKLGPTPNVAASPPPDDGKELDGRAGRPNVATDNVGCSAKHFNFTRFPYIGNPV